jgi:hypothetical protein
VVSGLKLQRRRRIAHEGSIDFNLCPIGIRRDPQPRPAVKRFALQSQIGGAHFGSVILPMFVDSLARVLHGVPERSCRPADNQVSRSALEDGNFVFAQNDRLSALVVENDDVVGYFLFVVDHYLIAALAEGLDDFSGLRTCTAASGSAEAVD